ncbi:Cyclic-di-AMP phosphodiesterase PgpH [Methylacidimicrobium cyclopophantes]|uniref:Cyclic-di-AMP phosphodiesterase PgpH n=1 Tax=Methylacidimicrobium cyclopophantes TaxID=1041766 RepID=A0A5E6MG75_9BACT|nr:HDIG domain-containing metalloprotein [Methylacidimicrobium cyclopophantes]VVM07245.1 Cyclic-di-AMP phosphodiesterase PgpH [Methylacidimicrobium cyclopophantes]
MSFWDRWQLVRKGLACGRSRRGTSCPKWREKLEKEKGVRVLIFLLFTLLCVVCGTWSHAHPTYAVVLLTTVLAAGIFIPMRIGLPELFESNSKLALVLIAVLINLFVGKGIYLWSMHQPGGEFRALYFYVPTAFAPLLTTSLLGAFPGLFTVFASSLFSAVLINQSIPLLVNNLVSGFVGVYMTQRVRRRRDLIQAGMAVGAVSLVCAVAFGYVGETESEVLIEQGAWSVVLGLLTGVFVNAILPFMEEVFCVNTDFTWLELSDLNHPLLRRLAAEAPGTYHHSLMVANLAEAAAQTIGANSALCRVMAYFHDIGKLVNPQYFAENMDGGENPHDRLSPSLSALVILSHVKDGVELAQRYHLKRPIIDGIEQHHGDSLVYYFYHRALRTIEDCKAGVRILGASEKDVPGFDESQFRYPGPKPQTRETGILMLADVVESASRSLERPTAQRIEQMVHELVLRKLSSHQLDECDLTLKELRSIEGSLSFTLKTMLHSRLRYPQKERDGSEARTLQPATSGTPLSASLAAPMGNGSSTDPGPGKTISAGH